jgi:hypothetical protein
MPADTKTPFNGPWLLLTDISVKYREFTEVSVGLTDISVKQGNS